MPCAPTRWIASDEEASFVLIAHSQGNLFVNSAYDGLRSSHSDTKVGVVHVAPASPTLRGEHMLADIDLVINGLRVQGINTVASNNISLPTSKNDLSGHTLVGTYLDAARAAREKVNGVVQAVLGKLYVLRREKNENDSIFEIAYRWRSLGRNACGLRWR